MDYKKRKCGALSIETEGAKSKVNIVGTRDDIIFNWIALTHQICKITHLPPYALAANMLPWMQEYESRELKEAISVNLKGVMKQKGGGNP